MIVIPVIRVDGLLIPSEQIPNEVTSIVCDGENYICYQGDEPNQGEPCAE